MSTNTTNPEATKKSPRRKIWITIAAAAVVAAIGIPAGAFAYNGYQTQQTAAAAAAAAAAADKAYQTAQKAYIHAADTTAMLGAREQNRQVLDTYQGAAAAVQAHPALFSPESVKALKADTDKYAALMKANYTPDKDTSRTGTWKLELPTGIPFSKKQVIEKYLASDKSRTTTWDALNSSIKANVAVLDKNLEVESTQADLVKAFGADLQSAAASAPKLKDPYVATVSKGSADAQAALTTALTGLHLTGTTVTKPYITTFKTYTDAADALKASHDQVVAAEQAAAQQAAEEAARQAAGDGGSGASGDGGSTGGGSSDGGSGGWNGGGGGSSGGGGSNGGGGSTGGSGGPGGTGGGGPSCWGNQENACDKTPPTYASDGNEVGYSSICSYYSSHNVGYGGRSLGGHPSGVKWAATVDGPTVTYYVCE